MGPEKTASSQSSAPESSPKKSSPSRPNSRPNRSERSSFKRSSSSSKSSEAPPASASRFSRASPPARRERPSGAPIEAGTLIRGRVDIHPDGFGFLIAKDPTLPNVYIGEESLRTIMHRDEVVARIDQSFEGGSKTRGTVVSIEHRSQTEILGIFRPHKGGALVIPMEARDRKHAFRVESGDVPYDQLKAGCAVLCRIAEYPGKSSGRVEVKALLEDPLAPSNDTLRVLLEAGWPREFPKAGLSEAEERARLWRGEIRLAPAGARRDLRSLPLVTIDGRDAKDFDDAVYAEKDGKGNIRLVVAIADVSLFVRAGSPLDREAYTRSTSVYFPDHVVPMLPEVLSNGVCSLNPFEERACLVCDAVVNPQGEIQQYEFYEGLMQSHRRMTYEDMQAFMEGQFWTRSELSQLEPSLHDLVDVYRSLNQARVRRGSIDLDLPEAKVIMNRDGTILDIQTRERLEAHRLIEECMLAANECAAKFLQDRGEGIYRIHEKPDERKVEDLLKFIALAGFDVKELDEPQDFAKLMAMLKRDLEPDDPTGRAIQTLVLRSLKQARYAAVPLGHFALANPNYTHFTSPIRRYPDLIVHRLIKRALRTEVLPALATGVTLEQAALHTSDQERSAMEAERKLIDIKKCRYIEKHLGEEFEAMVTGVVEKGLFCQLDGHFVDGLVSSAAIERAFRHRFDVQTLAYVGPGKSRIGLGSRLRVQVAAVDISTRKIDFAPIELLSASAPTPGGHVAPPPKQKNSKAESRSAEKRKAPQGKSKK